MRRTFLCLVVCLGLAACSSGSVSPVAKKPVEDDVDSRQPTKPRDPRTRAKLHTELGAMYLQAGNLTVALEELSIAILIDPDYATAYSMRGLAAYRIRELQLADQDFRRALSLDGKDPEINNNYGWFLCQVGREKEALGHIQAAMRNPLYKTPEKAYLNAGSCYAKIGDLATAEGYVQQSLRILPGNPQALLELANINYRKGDLELARQELGDLLRHNEPNAEALWLGVRIERALGNRSAEARYISQLRRKFPLSPEAQELLKGKPE
ncbi:MAG TPA: type IV pilus biogenesis/stability protein PilW [Candidatus Accumulibacter phosphatis]|nr:MAG: lipoprotein NlpI [Candidatus Accumulibacter sp. SK-11]HAY28334.1 type IV pilus biogenesis/stability protein PilW [Accumulibacter sp.]HRL76351.1 type IV pilus biogenesis/stability protein PilW [Candidatus Accumulibacter phosphatis]HCN67933.1 type IV pilus biogenesis/stability protein PilW [Accumulibacter sp.]HCV14212.1 type IV pilus biogenesis/stability protein PilW [Accumulibacter sp.]